MASSHSNTHTEAAKMEQIITEFFYKSLLIILESRSPLVSSRNFSGEQIVSSPSSSSSSSSSVRPRDPWFNLALRECPSALENLNLCRQSNFEPVVVDVILEKKPPDWEPASFSPQRALVRNLSSKDKNSFFWNSDQEESGSETKSEKIIERWFVQHESRKGRDCSSGSGSSNSNSLSTLYKKLILLLRSLYVTVRLLPAYKIFRDLNSSGRICAFKLVPRVSSSDEPIARKDETEMQRFCFTPVDTSCGTLCLSVMYPSSISDISLESSTPMSLQFIPDYFGSPLADPQRIFPSFPVSHSSSSSFQDDFDDFEFPCPFDVDYDDETDHSNRPESYDRRAHPSDLNGAQMFMNTNSQDPAVRALVSMLEEAPPLRQDMSSSINFSEASWPEMWSKSIQEQNQNSEVVTVEDTAASSSIASSRFVGAKTTADALEEVRRYKEMKNLLLSEGSKSCSSANYPSRAEYSGRGT